MRICFYVSGHGFGHAVRAIEIVNALKRRDPHLDVVMRTSVPQWFLDGSSAARVESLDGPTDTGVAQSDGLSVDEAATSARAAAYYREFDVHVGRERALLQQQRIDVVLADIPPLAFAAAAAADLRSIAIGNFTWSWIYEGYPCFDAEAPGVRPIIAGAEGQATVALRLPFSGGFDAMTNVEDMPLVARHARREPDDTRRRLGLDGQRPFVLASFGGHGGSVPLVSAAAHGGFTVVATDYEVENGGAPANVRIVSNRAMRDADVSYTDLLAACDLVVSKLGYGIVSECIANDVPLLYTTRGRFREQDVFERQLPDVLRCRAIARDQLIGGSWGEAIEGLLAQGRITRRMPSDGADRIAARVLELFRS